MKGVVTRTKSKYKYGFIVDEDGNKYKFNFKDCDGSVFAGNKVSFDKGKGTWGFEAINVRKENE